jgi:type IV pilus assembly protein PilY1
MDAHHILNEHKVVSAQNVVVNPRSVCDLRTVVAIPEFIVIGQTVIAVDVLTGSVLKKFTTGMNYCFPSSVFVIDENDNGFLDKVYVGDLGGQMWRFTSFVDNVGNPLAFPDCNENINDWTGQVFFKTDENNSRKFFCPPTVTLEKGYDMVFLGTGDRDNACCNNRNNVCSFTGPDIIAGVKETHSLTTIVGKTDLVDVTEPTVTPPNLGPDLGWYIRLVDDSGSAVGEKVLADGVVFYKTFYITTFTPSNDPNVSGGVGKLYALSYLTGAAVLDFNNDSNLERMSAVGGGIPSKPITLFTRTGTKLLVSVGSADPETASPSLGAGVKNIDPLRPPVNFFCRFWREVF